METTVWYAPQQIQIVLLSLRHSWGFWQAISSPQNSRIRCHCIYIHGGPDFSLKLNSTSEAIISAGKLKSGESLISLLSFKEKKKKTVLLILGCCVNKLRSNYFRGESTDKMSGISEMPKYKETKLFSSSEVAASSFHCVLLFIKLLLSKASLNSRIGYLPDSRAFVGVREWQGMRKCPQLSLGSREKKEGTCCNLGAPVQWAPYLPSTGGSSRRLCIANAIWWFACKGPLAHPAPFPKWKRAR